MDKMSSNPIPATQNESKLQSGQFLCMRNLQYNQYAGTSKSDAQYVSKVARKVLYI